MLVRRSGISGKVTFIDLITLMTFTTPFLSGIVAGSKMGWEGIAIGSAIGLSMGILGLLAFRRIMVALVKKEIVWLVIFALCCSYIGLFLSGMFAMWCVASVMRQGMVPRWSVLIMAVSLWCAVLVWMRSKRIFTKRVAQGPKQSVIT